MPEKFDPYLEWLDITPAEQPADYYRLLGVKVFETNSESIGNRADERMLVVRRHQNGKHAKQSQRILNELSAARSCLLDPKLRRIYDSKLAQILKKKQLPKLERPVDLLPQIEIPESCDPFSGTADLDEDHDPLEPIPPRPVWPYVVSTVVICLLIVGIILLIVFQRPD